MKKHLASALLLMASVTACSHSPTATTAKENKLVLEVKDIQVGGKDLQVPLKMSCVQGQTAITLQIGDFYKTFNCDEKGEVLYTHNIPTATLKETRKKKKDYVLRVRAFHEPKKNETLTQSLVIISSKDFQPRMEISQSLLTLEKMDGVFSDLRVHGQCRQGANVEVEIFDDWRGVSLEEEKFSCGELGFNYFSRRPGNMKRGSRLLIREVKNDKALSSFEVVLFN